VAVTATSKDHVITVGLSAGERPCSVKFGGAVSVTTTTTRAFTTTAPGSTKYDRTG
jgi:hypothetical protein